MEKIRSFIAINIGEATRARLSILQEQLKTSNAGIRWIAPENLHLTLAFLGNMETPQIQSLEDSLQQQFLHFPTFELTIRGTGLFGRRPRPSVVWAGIDASEQLLELQKRTVQAVHDSAVNYNDTSFRPHLTLGRFKSLTNLEPLFQMLEKEKETFFQALEVKSVEVIKSELKPGGAVYSVLREIPLAKR